VSAPLVRALPLAAAFAAALAAAAPPAAAAFDLAARARALVGEGQGVHVEAEDGTVLVSQAAARAVHPASVSKVPTTLALLRRLGSQHRFVTEFAAAGPLRDGTLEGDLVVRGSGDPFLVDENALLVGLALRGLGLRRVAGGLAVEGPLLFNWQSQEAGLRLRRALEGEVAPAAWQAVRAQAGSSGARPPVLGFGRAPRGGTPVRPLVVHRSQTLIPLVKALNGYSNNIFAPLADAAGGIAEVESLARASVPPEQRAEIVLGDGAGAHRANRLSPRASVSLLRALAAELARHGAVLSDVLPVAGVDEGTLLERLAGPGERGRVAGKTGTYGTYGACALVGALRTTRHGLVYFAILNRGVPVEEARRRQDAFVRVLLDALRPEPWPYVREEAPAFTRAQVEAAAAATARR
jgi:D-alanyl-D-alanine carboxypeptidase/D-alanyl-D-alanine-endopeptidase (penicillin-binding protein 4)